MKAAILFIASVFVFTACACEENDWEEDLDLGEDQQALTEVEAPDCVRYVDTQAAPGGDGLSWKTAVVSVEAALDLEAGEGEVDGPCEVWVKDTVENIEQLAEIVPQNKNIKVFDGFAGKETTRISKKSPVFTTVSADGPIHIANSVGGDLVKTGEGTGYEPVTVDHASVGMAGKGDSGKGDRD